MRLAHMAAATGQLLSLWPLRRCPGGSRQPGELLGCDRRRHGSGDRVLGQLPQDLELESEGKKTKNKTNKHTNVHTREE